MELNQNASHPWTNGAQLGLMGRILDKWNIIWTTKTNLLLMGRDDKINPEFLTPAG